MFKLFICLILFAGANVLAQAPKLLEASPLRDVLGFDTDLLEASLSPDGSTIAYSNDDEQLCLYTLEQATTECQDYPRELLESWGGNRILVTWSPDNNFLILSKDIYSYLRRDVPVKDGSLVEWLNIWQFAINEKTFGTISAAIAEGEPALNYLPTFALNGTLYFLHSSPKYEAERLFEQFSLELYEYSTAGALKQLVEFRPDFPALSMLKPFAVSPDGTRLALLVREDSPRANPVNGLWLYDLQTGEKEQIVKFGAMGLNEALPAWAGEMELEPQTVSWVSNDTLLLHVAQYRAQPSWFNTFYVDAKTKTLTPLEDFSELSEEMLEAPLDQDNPLSRVPSVHGVMTPDGQHYLFAGRDAEGIALWSSALPFGQAATLLAPLPDASFLHYSPATISNDGKHVVMGRYLLKFE